MNDPLSLHPCQHMVLSFKREKKKSSHSDGCAVVFHHGLNLHFPHDRASLVAQRLKCLPAMRETWVRSLGREDSLEKEMATHSSTLAWRIPWTEEPGGLQSTGRKESDATEWLLFHFSLSCTGEGNGNPLWCSCLENPRDAVAWWAAIYGVTQSRIRLKRLSSSSSQNTLDWGMVFGNQDPGPRGCSWLCGDSSLMPCQWTQLGCMYLLHVCLFTYVCSHLYLLSIHPSIYSSS